MLLRTRDKQTMLTVARVNHHERQYANPEEVVRKDGQRERQNQLAQQRIRGHPQQESGI